MNQAVIALGSNIDPEKNIQQAREILAQMYTVLAESHFKKTSPVGEIPQADFLNGTVLLETTLREEELRNELKRVESTLGREERHDPQAPRTIDLDIVVWNNKIVDQDFYERDYLKSSVLELLPDLPR